MFSTEAQMTRLINWIAVVFALGLLAAVLFNIYQRHLFSDSFGDSADFQFSDLPGQGDAPLSAGVADIIDQHLFGSRPAKAKAVAIAPAPSVEKTAPPRAKLNVELIGVVEGTGGGGMAMLRLENRKTAVVSVGEEIGKTQATLTAVHAGEISVDRDGYEETIKMVRKKLTVAKLDADPNLLPQPSAGLDDAELLESQLRAEESARIMQQQRTENLSKADAFQIQSQIQPHTERPPEIAEPEGSEGHGAPGLQVF